MRFSILILLVLASIARAESPYVAAGREELAAGRFETARIAFERAAETSPNDPAPLAFLGRALLLLDRHEEAVTALTHARALEDLAPRKAASPPPPDTPRVRSALGHALYGTGRYEAAAEELREALHRDPNDPEALYYLGLTLQRLGRSPDAETLFARVPADDPVFGASAAQMRAFSLEAQGRTEEASQVLADLPAPPESHPRFSRPAEVLHTARERSEPDRFRVSVLVAAEYDSNVLLSPEIAGSAVSQQSDTSTTALLVGEFLLVDRMPLYLTYSGFLDEHHKTNELDLLSNSATLAYRWQELDQKFEINYGFQYFHIDRKPYLSRHGLGASYRLEAGAHHTIETRVHATLRRFRPQDFRGYDGWENRSEVAWDIHDAAGRLGMRFGYAFDVDRSDRKDYSFLAHQGRVQTRLPVGDDTSVRLDMDYRWEGYRQADELFGKLRNDSRLEIALGLSHDMGEDWDIALDLRHTENNSNIRSFEYEKEVVTLSAFLRF